MDSSKSILVRPRETNSTSKRVDFGIFVCIWWKPFFGQQKIHLVSRVDRWKTEIRRGSDIARLDLFLAKSYFHDRDCRVDVFFSHLKGNAPKRRNSEKGPSLPCQNPDVSRIRTSKSISPGNFDTFLLSVFCTKTFQGGYELENHDFLCDFGADFLLLPLAGLARTGIKHSRQERKINEFPKRKRRFAQTMLQTVETACKE